MGQASLGCCGHKAPLSHCGQPAVAKGDDLCPPQPAVPGDIGSFQILPGWLPALAPHLAGEEAARAAAAWSLAKEELVNRTQSFVERARKGVQCHVIDPRRKRVLHAWYTLNDSLESIVVHVSRPEQEFGEPEVHKPQGRQQSIWECPLAEVRNIWTRADSELARRVHSSLEDDGPGYNCILLIDSPTGPISLVEESWEAQEEFLDCMAVLISAWRLRSEPDVACCFWSDGPPAPEPRLRPLGKSLQSMHISGPICEWLAQVGEQVLPPSPRAKKPSKLEGETTPRKGANVISRNDYV
mmetsp:Transcript_29161/g.77044  ORF Transcript_29161/g.77044 Transcript_29161/m.77044 type:complete len:298 (-) Transcript_29161:272-1165(-)